MKINIFKAPALLFALASLFLPWISSAFFLNSTSFSLATTYNFAPLFLHGTSVSRSSDGILRTTTVCRPEFIPLLHPYNLIIWIRYGFQMDTSVMFLTYGYVFFVCFLVAGLFVTSIWKDYAKRVLLVAFFMWLLGTVAYLSFQVWKCNVWNQAINTAKTALEQHEGEVVYVNSNILDAGFYSALLSVMFTCVSYWHPKFIELPLNFRMKIFGKFKEGWLAVPNRERLPAIFLTALLLTWLLGYLIYDVLPILKIY